MSSRELSQAEFPSARVVLARDDRADRLVEEILAEVGRVRGGALRPPEQDAWDRRWRAGAYFERAAVDDVRSRASTEALPSTKALSSTEALPSTKALSSIETLALATEDRFLPIDGYAHPSTQDVSRFAKSRGRHGRLNGPEFRVWALRLSIQQGLRKPATVPMPELPASATPIHRKVAEGFLLLCACRWTDTPGAPAPFDREFAAAWCAVTPRQARDARDYLERVGAIRHDGWHGRMKLWLPGISA
jgi:hypothetical protein